MVVDPDTPLNRALAKAVDSDDVAAVRSLIARGASADTRVGWSNSPSTWPLPMRLTYRLPDTAASDRAIFDLLIADVKNVNAADTEFGDTLLMAAAQFGDDAAVQRLVDAGADVNARSKTYSLGSPMGNSKGKRMMAGNDSALLQAIPGRHNLHDNESVPQTVSILITHGADVNAQDASGATPLMEAAQAGETGVVQFLLTRGANPTLRDLRGHDALFCARMANRKDIVDILMPLVKSSMTLDEAAAMGQVDQIARCLDAGQDPNAQNSRGWTPLMSAVSSGNPKAVKLLIDRGARVNGAGLEETTALAVAAKLGQTEIGKLLLDNGADVNAAAIVKGRFGRNDSVYTPLETAAINSQAGMVELMLSRHVDLVRYNQGAMALEAAVHVAGNTLDAQHPPRGMPLLLPRTQDQVLHDQDRVMELLLDAGVKPTFNHSHVLYTAANAGQCGIVDLLLHHGADVNGRANTTPGTLELGQTALAGAVEYYWLAYGTAHDPAIQTIGGDPNGWKVQCSNASATVELLLARHADVNLPDSSGATPLMECIRDQLPILAKRMVEADSKVDAFDHDGLSPLMLCALEGDSETARILVARGANVNARDKFGYTPLMIALFVPTPTVDATTGLDGEMDETPRTPTPAREHNDALAQWFNQDASASAGRLAVVRLLLERHADATVCAKDGMTAASLARVNRLDAASALLAKIPHERQGNIDRPK
ncbi:MAG: ankyrin repeat domain-containing protein [Capsulimonadaceae bacterium]